MILHFRQFVWYNGIFHKTVQMLLIANVRQVFDTITQISNNY